MLNTKVLRTVLPKLVKKQSFRLAILQFAVAGIILILLVEQTVLLSFEDALYRTLDRWLRFNDRDRPLPKFGIWYVAAMIGNLLTILFTIAAMFRARAGREANLAFAILFGMLLVMVGLGGFPALYFGAEAAAVNAVLTFFYCCFDIYGYIDSDRFDERHEYTIDFWFLNAPTFVASSFLVFTLHHLGIEGDSPFSIGISAGMLVLLVIVSALSALYVSLANSGLGALFPRRRIPERFPEKATSTRSLK
jgi:hypothetical protein